MSGESAKLKTYTAWLPRGLKQKVPRRLSKGVSMLSHKSFNSLLLICILFAQLAKEPAQNASNALGVKPAVAAQMQDTMEKKIPINSQTIGIKSYAKSYPTDAVSYYQEKQKTLIVALMTNNH